MRLKSTFWILLAILIFSLLSKSVYFISYIGRNPFSGALILDSFRYDQWARSLLEGRVFEQGAFYQAPFYPCFLSLLYAVFGPSLNHVYIAQMLIGLISILLVFVVARRYFSDEAALLASALFALHPTMTFFESKLLPETLAVLFGLLLLYILAKLEESRGATEGRKGENSGGAKAGDEEGRERDGKGKAESEKERKGGRRDRIVIYFLAAISGLLLGITCLIRPNMLVLFPLIVLWIILSGWRKRNPVSRFLIPAFHEGSSHFSGAARSSGNIGHPDSEKTGPGYQGAIRNIFLAIVFTAGLFAAILPVTIRNYLNSDEFVLISLNGGITFCQGNNPYANGIYTPLPGFSGDISQQRQEERYYAQAETKRKLSDPEVSKFWFGKGLQFIKENPWTWLLLEAKKFFYFFDNYEHSLEYNYSVERSYTVNLGFIPFGIIIPFAMIGIFLSFPWKGKAPLMLYLLAQFATVMIFYMSSRYRLPAIPALVIFAGAGLLNFFDIIRGRENNKDHEKSIIPKREINGEKSNNELEIVGDDLNSRGILPRMKGKSDHAKMSDSEKSNDSEKRIDDETKSGIETSGGGAKIRVKERRNILFMTVIVIIIAAFSFARMGDVYRFEEAASHGNLGTAFNAAGLHEEALSSFKKQAELDPGSAYALFNIAVVMAKTGKEGEAVQYYEQAIKINPDLAEAYNNLGVIFVNSGECAQAEALFLKAIELKPFFANPYNNLAACYLMKEEFNKALKIVQLAKARGLSLSDELVKEILGKSQKIESKKE